MLSLPTEIMIRDRAVGEGREIYVIAEMACAHDGDLGKAKALIEAAADARVDAIQFQIFSVEDLLVPTHKIFNLLKKIEFSPTDWKLLFDYARKRRLTVSVCAYDLPSADFAVRSGADAIKVNSSDLSNPEMVKFIAGSGIPFTLGTGASTMKEIEEAINTALEVGGDQFILMHGVQNFPTDYREANINRIKLLRKKFRSIVGYQDHTDAGLSLSRVIDLLAIGAGASVIEKHISLDRSEKGTDFQAALEPIELSEFVGLVRKGSAAVGTEEDIPLTDGDQKYRRFQKKSIVAASDISQGEEIKREKVVFLRVDAPPALPPSNLDKILEKRAQRDIRRFEQIKPDDVVD